MPPDQLFDLVYQQASEPGLLALFRREALIDQQVEQAVDIIIAEAEIAFVGLAGEEIGRWPFGGKILRHSEMPGEDSNLGVVKIAQRIHGIPQVAEQGAIPEENFRFIRRHDYEGFLDRR